MGRIARVVVPGVPHHVTQRGNRRQTIFFEEDDYRLHRDLIAVAARRAHAEIWANCFMPNHVHLIVTPSDEGGLRATFAEAHRRYTGTINARFRWTGHLFQGRFGAVAMDGVHLLAAARYIALNPVSAKLVARAQDWPWSSTGAHLRGRDDELVTVTPLLRRIPDFAALVDTEPTFVADGIFERAAIIGRPLGAPEWIAALEQRLGRRLVPRKRGPKPHERPDLRAQLSLLE